jgi:CDP-glycerol glycerophosphotransferase (TagB/SpsB family)
VVTDSDVAPLLQSADVMVSDTSSIIGEFALLGKPAVTLNNSEPGDYLIDIAQAKDLEAAVISALDPPDTLQQSIRRYAQDLHPYNDGLSAKRVLAATQERLAKGRQGLKQRPLNLFRNLKMRHQLGYWRW